MYSSEVSSVRCHVLILAMDLSGPNYSPPSEHIHKVNPALKVTISMDGLHATCSSELPAPAPAVTEDAIQIPILSTAKQSGGGGISKKLKAAVSLHFS